MPSCLADRVRRLGDPLHGWLLIILTGYAILPLRRLFALSLILQAMAFSIHWIYLTMLLTPVAVSGWHMETIAGVTTRRSHAHAHAYRHQGTVRSRLQASSQSTEGHAPVVSRRFIIVGIVAGIKAGAVPKPALAISTDAAKDQWKKSVAVIDAMLSDWPILEKKGGDAIRVELGTQGTTSPLFQVDKALKALREEAEDLVEFTEQSDEFMLRLAAADSMAYSANFAGGSGKPTPPAVYIEKSKTEVEDMQRIAKALSALLL